MVHYDGKIIFMQHCLGSRNKIQLKVVGAVWAAIVWSVWNHRNVVLFRDVEGDVGKVVEQCKFKAWCWLRAKLPSFSFSFSNGYIILRFVFHNSSFYIVNGC